MTPRSQQQTARVNIDDERWREIRILAIESDRSIAEHLGQLVRDGSGDLDDADARRSKWMVPQQTRPPRAG